MKLSFGDKLSAILAAIRSEYNDFPEMAAPVEGGPDEATAVLGSPCGHDPFRGIYRQGVHAVTILSL